MTDNWIEYKQIRKNNKLIYSEQEKCYLVAKYEDVNFFLKSNDVTVEYPFRASKQVFGSTILDSDKPNNIDIRKSLTPFFSKKAVDNYEELMIRPLIKTLINNLDSESIDFNYWIAQRIPTQIVMNIFGIDLKYERYLYSHLHSLVLYIDHPSNSLSIATESKNELLSFLEKCIYGDININDNCLLSSLNHEVFKNKDEMLGTCLMLLTAGMATTIASLNILVINMFKQADTIKHIKKDHEKLTKFVSETIRIEPPLHSTIRFVKNDFTYKNNSLKKHDMLKLIIAGANRDELHYEKPMQIDLNKKNDSCSFGKGKHACIGGYLAIKELVVFAEEFIPLMESFEINADSSPFMDGNVIKMYKNIILTKK